MNCFIYCRISSKNQKDGVSLDMQEDVCRKKALELGYNIVDVYEEIGSAYKGEQKTLNYMIKLMPVGSVLMVYRIDRFSRNMRKAFKLLDKMEKKNIKLMSATEVIDMETSSGKKYFNSLLVESQSESDRISERITSSIKYIRSNNGHIGKPPLGFKIQKGSDNINRLVKDDENYRLVKKIVDAIVSEQINNVTDGMSKISTSYNFKSGRKQSSITKAYKLLSAKNIKIHGKPITLSTINTIFRNRNLYK